MDKNESGKCQCGKISYTFNKEKVISAHHCHCKDCQRATGCGKATIIFLAKKNIEVEGELKYYESVGTAGSHVRRGFCAECGSGVLSYAKDVPHIIYLKAGTLEDSSWIKIDSNFLQVRLKNGISLMKQLKVLKKTQDLCLVLKLY